MPDRKISLYCPSCSPSACKRLSSPSKMRTGVRVNSPPSTDWAGRGARLRPSTPKNTVKTFEEKRSSAVVEPVLFHRRTREYRRVVCKIVERIQVVAFSSDGLHRPRGIVREYFQY